MCIRDRDKVFETLLENKKINHKNRTRVMDICRDWVQLETESSLEKLFNAI